MVCIMVKDTIIDKDELETTLALNIGLLAKKLQDAKIDLTELDKVGIDVLELIHKRAEQVAIKNPLETINIENIIIMVLMHGALVSQKEFINDTSKSLNMSAKMIESMMIKDTTGRDKNEN